MSYQQSPFSDAALAAPRLPQFVRFRDLRTAGITDNWPHLLRMIDEQHFPEGKLLSPNIRVWDLDEVRQWLAARPTARKIVAPAKRPRRRHEQNAEPASAA